MFGYAGKILRVDLTKNSCKKEKLDEKLVQRFVGGYGIGAKILYDEVPAWVGALDPAIVLYFSFDTVAGNEVADLSGKGNNGSIINAKAVNGKYGSALEFDGEALLHFSQAVDLA